MKSKVITVTAGKPCVWTLQARGYFAVGGEAFLLFLPVFYYIISESIKDFIREVKHDWHNWSDDD